MKKVILSILVVTALAFLSLNRQVVASSAYNLLYKSPCDSPKHYHIGSVDPRFTISHEDLLVAIEEAANIWNTSYGKKIFTYDENAAMAINLVYDERQTINTSINSLNDDLKQKDNALKPELEEYHRRFNALQSRITSLNEEIRSWNAKGGAPPEEYQRLKAEQESIREEGNTLNELARSLSLKTNDFNTEVRELDEKISQFNDSLNEKPEGGIYELNVKEEKIDVYIYSTRDELISILAHELGHSIGMNHVRNEDAIMFSRANITNVPADEDSKQLQDACKKQNVVFMQLKAASYSLNHALNKLKATN